MATSSLDKTFVVNDWEAIKQLDWDLAHPVEVKLKRTPEPTQTEIDKIICQIKQRFHF
ncbi:hypothetical protein [Lonepinella sp. BR2271]|uniref:hypothetical protein n=1 Tax=Lonepinella sp. BR2271 TaxID=3434550 RepID=UPI003F6E3306